MRYEANQAEKRYRCADPENRLVARTLEAQWEEKLNELARAENELAGRQGNTPKPLTDQQQKQLHELGDDLKLVWHAESTTDRDRKELLNILLEEVSIRIDKSNTETKKTAILILRWQGGMITELTVDVRSYREPALRTDENTIELVRRLAQHYNDELIAGILNRQGRKTATGERFTLNRVGNLRRYWKIPRYEQSKDPSQGELVNLDQAANILGVVRSTLHRWINEGIIAGEQLTPGAPWRIRITDELKSRFREEAPPGFVRMQEATRILGITRQAVLQRVKRGELEAIHVQQGRSKGLRIKAIDNNLTLFDE